MRVLGQAVMAAAVLAGSGVVHAQISVEPPAQTTAPAGGEGAQVAPPTIAPPTISPPQIVPPGNPIPITTTAPATAPATTQSAESILQELLHKGSVERAVPESISPKPEADGLLRESQAIMNRTGRLKKDPVSGAMTFAFDNKPGEEPYPPMGAVPSRRLAIMEDASEYGERPMTFSIVAEVTQYRGKNFLYLKNPTDTFLSAAEAPVASTPSPATTAASRPAGEGQQLIETVAPKTPATARLAESDMIWGRTGRLIRDPKTGTEVIAFDSDGKQMTDPPLGVLPCNWLAIMEDASDHGAKAIKFRVSGEVTLYRGKNYLYLNSVQVIKDLNQGIGAGADVHAATPSVRPAK